VLFHSLAPLAAMSHDMLSGMAFRRPSSWPSSQPLLRAGDCFPYSIVQFVCRLCSRSTRTNFRVLAAAFAPEAVEPTFLRFSFPDPRCNIREGRRLTSGCAFDFAMP
jgi:hypothetical protein